MNSERYYAEMESARHAREEAYFSARPQLDSPANRELFREGFQRGFSELWDRCQSAGEVQS